MAALFGPPCIHAQNEAPEVPLYATAYLNVNEVEDGSSWSDPAAAAADPTQARALRTCFTQPGIMPDFLHKVNETKVAALQHCCRLSLVSSS